MLFQWDITHDDIDRSSANILPESSLRAAGGRRFCEPACLGTVEHVEEIDELIRVMPSTGVWIEWPSVDRNLLRLAAQEFLYDKETPKTVVINEAIEIARRFSARNLRSSLTAYWTASRRNWKVNGNTRTDSHSKAEGDPGTRLRPVSNFLSYTHSLARVAKEFSDKSAEELEQSNTKVRVAGRILTNRPFGKGGIHHAV